MIAPGAISYALEPAVDRPFEDARAVGDRLGDDEVFELFVGRARLQSEAFDFQFDFSAAAHRELRKRIAERLVIALQDFEPAGISRPSDSSGAGW